MGAKHGSLADRFNTRMQPSSDGCILWTGYISEKGYGTIYQHTPVRKMRKAHQVSYELSVGPIPEGMVVMHTCDNPPCVNPKHLRLGTQLENVEDMRIKGRASKGPTHFRVARNLSNGRAELCSQVFDLRSFGYTREEIGLMIGCEVKEIKEMLRSHSKSASSKALQPKVGY
jgi:hypothetical protein